MRREIGGARVVRVGNVRCQRKDHRCPRWRAIRRFRQIKCRIQFNLVAHRDFHPPAQIVISGSRRRFLGRRRGLGWWRLRLKKIQRKQQDDERPSRVHQRIEPRTLITTRKFRGAKAICGRYVRVLLRRAGRLRSGGIWTAAEGCVGYRTVEKHLDPPSCTLEPKCATLPKHHLVPSSIGFRIVPKSVQGASTLQMRKCNALSSTGCQPKCSLAKSSRRSFAGPR